MSERIQEIIKELRSMQNAAQVVLDSGFGTHEGECDTVYRKRRNLAKDAADIIESLQRERQERENPKPLTVERMREIVLNHEDNAVWVKPTYWFNNGHTHRALLDVFQDHIVALDARSMTSGIDDETFDEYNYGKTWLAYATEPKGEKL